MLPNLYHDLINNSTDTLSKYKLTMQHINTEEPNSKLSQKILEDFCFAAAEAMKTECGWEYRFASESKKTRATILSELRINELEGLATNNLIVERNFSKFDQIWKVERSCKYKFKAKAIRNCMNLIDSDNFEVGKIAKKIMLTLTENLTGMMKLGLMKKRLHQKQKKDYKKQRITSKQCKSMGWTLCSSWWTTTDSNTKSWLKWKIYKNWNGILKMIRQSKLNFFYLMG